MTAQHTPGPWDRAYGNSVYAGTHEEAVMGAPLIATCWPLSGETRELEMAFSNARLVSAAPDLLIALESLLEWCILKEKGSPYVASVRKPIVIEQVKQAIRKAKG